LALHIACFVGARPNFMKVAPLLRLLRQDRQFAPSFVHTGQHYDFQMSEVFLHDLGLPAPDALFEVGSGTHAAQTARVMSATEHYFNRFRPDWAVVVGDVNSTLGVALTAARMGIAVAHVEAGLRSGDRAMPEEINRIATDHLSRLLFLPSADAGENLEREGVDRSRMRLVGNVMVDSLFLVLPRARKAEVWARYQLAPKHYCVVTAHRPENVDNRLHLRRLTDILAQVAARLPAVLPLHPRTRQRLEQARALAALQEVPGLHLTEPLGYLDFLGLVDGAAVALTDSGGLQEETTALGIPCLTLRENTERPITVTVGTNTLTGLDPLAVSACLDQVLAGTYKVGAIPPLWDGKAAERIVRAFTE